MSVLGLRGRGERLAAYLGMVLMAGCGVGHDSDRPAVVNTPTATNVKPAEQKPVTDTPETETPHPEVADVQDLELPDLGEFSGPATLAVLRQQRDETVWRKETLAQQHERALVRLWDALIAAGRDPQGDTFAVIGAQAFQSITVAAPGVAQPIRWNATVAVCDQSPQTWSMADWQQQVTALRDAGYRIVQTEWHHAKFDEATDGRHASTVNMAIYAQHPERVERLVIGGDLKIVWQAQRDDANYPVPETIDARGLKLYRRPGPVGFRHILTIDHAQPGDRSGVQPILLQDMNDDGLSELIVGGSNELYWNRGQGNFERDTLCDHPEPGYEVGLIADLTGDAQVDFLRPGLAGDLLLFVGDGSGRFPAPPIGRAKGGGPLRQPQVIAAGDIDRDGDLDLWIGQYKISYIQGQMPTPYYDANDGFPAYLLINEGNGRFVPRTEEAGLAPKQYRRSYGGSFVDVDRDGDLDLVVVSDFAGIDLYLNDGQGHFTDVTEAQLDERHLFGMALSFADFNLDGRLDFFATGMASTTARRLEYMQLGRDDRADIHQMRSKMGYGNRMYLRTEHGFEQPLFRDTVARTGWTWGATSLDVDNDSFVDIFVANGHSSGESTKDHCSHFWCHDIYDGTSAPNPEVQKVFNTVMQGYFDRSESWDGYQKNALLVNLDGNEFINLGFLMGVGHEYDGRAVVSDDLDGDGRRDLIVVEDRWKDGQLVHVYRNELETENHWIGIQLVDRPGSDSPLGAIVVARLSDQSSRIAAVVAGDSIHAQHATTVHFGLGGQDQVAAIEVHLASGRVIRLAEPAADRYHRVEIE